MGKLYVHLIYRFMISSIVKPNHFFGLLLLVFGVVFVAIPMVTGAAAAAVAVAINAGAAGVGDLWDKSNTGAGPCVLIGVVGGCCCCCCFVCGCCIDAIGMPAAECLTCVCMCAFRLALW